MRGATCVSVTLLAWVLGSASAAGVGWTSPRLLATRAAAESLHPQLCQFRFWKQRFSTYCDGVTDAQALSGTRDNTTAQPPLNVFEVHTPVRVGSQYLLGNLTGKQRAAVMRDEAKSCTQVLMVHTFGLSYGMPFVGSYTPPSCEWTHVIFNLTMTSQGHQYDRLALMFLNDTEVFRTSTAEPTSYGIVTHYVKDMTRFSVLLREPHQIIFDLGNLLNDVYTGSFNTTLTATYYSPPIVNGVNPADSIFPISQRIGNTGQPSHFSLPAQNATSAISIPKNAIRAVVGVSGSGNAEEEFWYTNVPTSYISTFNHSGDGLFATLYGYSPFREIQVLVDGTLAGVAWPFVTIFTGGIVPSFWRPIVSITAYDLPEYEVDITPFLPLLTDGAAHTFEIRVVSYDETTNTIGTGLGSDWLVSGRVFVWTDADANHTTTGAVLTQSTPDPEFTYTPKLTQTSNGTNLTLEVTIAAQRSLAISSVITTSTGNKSVSWTQDLRYSNYMNLTTGGDDQWVITETSGTDVATVGFVEASRSYRYPLTVWQFYNAADELDVNIASFLQSGLENDGVQFLTMGSLGGAGALDTHIVANATWKLNVGGNGTTAQNWSWKAAELENMEGALSYDRRVKSVDFVNSTQVVSDREVINGKTVR